MHPPGLEQTILSPTRPFLLCLFEKLVNKMTRCNYMYLQCDRV